MRLTMADIDTVSRFEGDQQRVNQGKLKALNHRVQLLAPLWQRIM